MNKGKVSIMALVMSVTLLCSSNVTVFAASDLKQEAYVNYSIEMENDDVLQGATHISSEVFIKDGRQITKDVYRQKDGTTVTDTLDVSAIAAYSKDGSDTATRTRDISEWGSVTITASFSWYTEGLFSYVKCTSMNASRSLNSNAVVSTWDTSHTEDYVSIGTAHAQVKYNFYNKQFPAQYQKGTFKVSCSDAGSISDNA